MRTFALLASLFFGVQTAQALDLGALSANCWCKISIHSLSGFFAETGVVAGKYPNANGPMYTHGQVFFDLPSTQANCRNRCNSRVAGENLPALAQAACAMGADGHDVVAFAKVGTTRFVQGNVLGRIHRRPAVYHCPQGGNLVSRAETRECVIFEKGILPNVDKGSTTGVRCSPGFTWDGAHCRKVYAPVIQTPAYCGF
jgi:hypothetical protein